MSLTGQQLLVGFSKFIGDYVNSTTTSAGSSTTVVDGGVMSHTRGGSVGEYAMGAIAFKEASSTVDVKSLAALGVG